MPKPGDGTGDCPRCGGDRILVGHGEVVVGAYCDRCELLVALGGDAITVHEARRWADRLAAQEAEPDG